jgi:hypothetical protein
MLQDDGQRDGDGCPNFSLRIIEVLRCAGQPSSRVGRRGDPMECHLSIAIFAQGDTCCAVCAPRVASQDVVEMAVTLLDLSRAADWKVLNGPFLDGRPNPYACPHNGLRQHWLLVRMSGNTSGLRGFLPSPSSPTSGPLSH